MINTNLIKIIGNFVTDNQQEKIDLIQIKNLFLKHQENLYERSCLSAHLTGSALVFNPNTKQFLLHFHKKLNKWLQFGGHADGETDLAKVAMKEALEESGLTDLYFPKLGLVDNLSDNNLPANLPIDIEVQNIPAKAEVPAHLHLDFRYLLFTKTLTLPKPAATESQSLTWLSYEEIMAKPTSFDLALIRLIKKAWNLTQENTNNS